MSKGNIAKDYLKSPIEVAVGRNNCVHELSAQEQMFQSFGIPMISAAAITVPYTAAKQWQSNLQSGTTNSIFGLKGIRTIFLQQQLRSLFKLGPVPIVKKYAQENHPDFITSETAGCLAIIFCSLLADVLLAPVERLSIAQQTYDNSICVTKPSFLSWKKEGVLLRESWRGVNATMLRTSLFMVPFVFSRNFFENNIVPPAEEQTFRHKATIAAGASVVGMATDVVITPFSRVAQLTQRCHNPLSYQEAFKHTVQSGFKYAYTGCASRLAVCGVVSLGSAGALAWQEIYAGNRNGEQAHR